MTDDDSGWNATLHAAGCTCPHPEIVKHVVAQSDWFRMVDVEVLHEPTCPLLLLSNAEWN